MMYVSYSVTFCLMPLRQGPLLNLEFVAAQQGWIATELWGANCL